MFVGWRALLTKSDGTAACACYTELPCSEGGIFPGNVQPRALPWADSLSPVGATIQNAEAQGGALG